MARYVCSYRVKTSLPELHSLLTQIFKSCHCDVVYNTNDYIMAKEIPGQVKLRKLVTLEALIDTTTAQQTFKTNLVVKNDELPLKLENHCKEIFEQIKAEIAKLEQWNLIGRSNRLQTQKESENIDNSQIKI